MEIALSLFFSLIKGVCEEMRRLEGAQALGQCSREHALNRIFQEHVLRYIALRSFYEDSECLHVRYRTETDGPIDLILEAESAEIAFEFKRWQTAKGLSEIKNKDYDKLLNFKKLKRNRAGYSIVYTLNEFNKTKAEFEAEFKERLAAQYRLEKIEVIDIKGHSICLFLATPLRRRQKRVAGVAIH